MEKNVQAHKSNQHPLSSHINRIISLDMTGSNSDDGHDEFTETHPDGTDEEETTTTDTVNKLHTDDGRYGVYYISDDSKKKKSNIKRIFLVTEQGEDILDDETVCDTG